MQFGQKYMSKKWIFLISLHSLITFLKSFIQFNSWRTGRGWLDRESVEGFSPFCLWSGFVQKKEVKQYDFKSVNDVKYKSVSIEHRYFFDLTKCLQLNAVNKYTLKIEKICFSPKRVNSALLAKVWFSPSWSHLSAIWAKRAASKGYSNPW